LRKLTDCFTIGQWKINLQNGLEAITTKKVTIKANAHNTLVVLHSTGDEENLSVLNPMQNDGK